MTTRTHILVGLGSSGHRFVREAKKLHNYLPTEERAHTFFRALAPFQQLGVGESMRKPLEANEVFPFWLRQLVETTDALECGECNEGWSEFQDWLPDPEVCDECWMYSPSIENARPLGRLAWKTQASVIDRFLELTKQSTFPSDSRPTWILTVSLIDGFGTGLLLEALSHLIERCAGRIFVFILLPIGLLEDHEGAIAYSTLQELHNWPLYQRLNPPRIASKTSKSQPFHIYFLHDLSEERDSWKARSVLPFLVRNLSEKWHTFHCPSLHSLEGLPCGAMAAEAVDVASVEMLEKAILQIFKAWSEDPSLLEELISGLEEKFNEDANQKPTTRRLGSQDPLDAMIQVGTHAFFEKFSDKIEELCKASSSGWGWFKPPKRVKEIESIKNLIQYTKESYPPKGGQHFNLPNEITEIIELVVQERAKEWGESITNGGSKRLPLSRLTTRIKSTFDGLQSSTLQAEARAEWERVKQKSKEQSQAPHLDRRNRALLEIHLSCAQILALKEQPLFRLMAEVVIFERFRDIFKESQNAKTRRFPGTIPTSEPISEAPYPALAELLIKFLRMKDEDPLEWFGALADETEKTQKSMAHQLAISIFDDDNRIREESLHFYLNQTNTSFDEAIKHLRFDFFAMSTPNVPFQQCLGLRPERFDWWYSGVRIIEPDAKLSELTEDYLNTACGVARTDKSLLLIHYQESLHPIQHLVYLENWRRAYRKHRNIECLHTDRRLVGHKDFQDVLCDSTPPVPCGNPGCSENIAELDTSIRTCPNCQRPILSRCGNSDCPLTALHLHPDAQKRTCPECDGLNHTHWWSCDQHGKHTKFWPRDVDECPDCRECHRKDPVKFPELSISKRPH